MNRLFVANKPENISSNNFLRDIKRKYNVKKAGYSGTLDPFAEGVRIIAFGQYTKLFNYLKKSPKLYRAVLQLGAYSPTLDSEKIVRVEKIKRIDISILKDTINSLKGEVEYLPPKYSAKSIDGQRAYKLAREGKEFELKKIKSFIFDIKLLSYEHPFVSFEVSISEGGYVRSIANMISKSLQTTGALTKLQRLKEGEFVYNNEKELNPLEYIDTKPNEYLGNYDDITLGKKLDINLFKIKDDGKYHLRNGKYLTIIEIANLKVSYKLNRIRMQGC